MHPFSRLSSALLKKAITSCSWKPPTNLHRSRPFSSPVASASCKKWSYFSEDDSETGRSSVYDHALKFQRPSTIKYGHTTRQYKRLPINCVSFIGTVDLPLKRVESRHHFGVYTTLRVKPSPSQSKHSSFRVLLNMWDEMAEVAINHLKPNDFVYVWGNLGSYMKADKCGNSRMCYKVVVKELNYVTQHGEKPMHQQAQKPDLQGEDYLERQRNRIHLWQEFFVNPYEWRDFRKTKTNPKHPDFKNMSTGEALWFMDSDPPWITRQLQFLDSVLAGQSLGGGYMNSTSSCSLLTNDIMGESETLIEEHR